MSKMSAGQWVAVPAEDGKVFNAYVARPAQGSGPGIVVLQEIFGVNRNIQGVCDTLAEEGYVAIAPDLFWRTEPGVALDNYDDADRKRASALMAGFDARLGMQDIAATIAALRKLPGFVGKVGVVGFCLGGRLAYQAAAAGLVDCAVSYYGTGVDKYLEAAAQVRVPITFHYGSLDHHVGPEAVGKIRAAFAGAPDAKVHVYAGARHGFASAQRPDHDAPASALAYSRTIAAFRRVLGPHYDLEDLWDNHLACEFTRQDATATMATMVDEPYVNHIPTLTGGVGHDLLKRFYKYHFVNQVPSDRKTIPISRTVGADRVIEEKVFCFTHDEEIDWLLPGVPPTGKYVEIPIVGIITFRGDKLVNEHIYWDQASVLVQVGLLDPTGLPVAGREQARKLLDKSLPSNAMLPSWESSADKPL